jgi:hypothetical protein
VQKTLVFRQKTVVSRPKSPQNNPFLAVQRPFRFIPKKTPLWLPVGVELRAFKGQDGLS